MNKKNEVVDIPTIQILNSVFTPLEIVSDDMKGFLRVKITFLVSYENIERIVYFMETREEIIFEHLGHTFRTSNIIKNAIEHRYHDVVVYLFLSDEPIELITALEEKRVAILEISKAQDKLKLAETTINNIYNNS